MKNAGLDKAEIRSLYHAMYQIELIEDLKIGVHGIYQEDDGTWIATSDEYGKWHTHGKGSTIYAAIIDMAAKVTDYFKKNEDLPQ